MTRLYTIVLGNGRTLGRYPSKDAFTAASKAFTAWRGDNDALVLTMGELVDGAVVRQYRYRVMRVPLDSPRTVTKGGNTFVITHENRVRALRWS